MSNVARLAVLHSKIPLPPATRRVLDGRRGLDDPRTEKDYALNWADERCGIGLLGVPGAVSVRVWGIMSRCRGPRTRRPPPEGRSC